MLRKEYILRSLGPTWDAEYHYIVYPHHRGPLQTQPSLLASCKVLMSHGQVPCPGGLRNMVSIVLRPLIQAALGRSGQGIILRKYVDRKGSWILPPPAPWVSKRVVYIYSVCSHTIPSTHGYNKDVVHTGSRGLGASILARQITSECNPYIPPDAPHLSAYLAEHDYAVKWAEANRDLVAHRIMQCIYSPSDLDDSLGPSALLSNNLEKIIDVTHNSVTKDSLTVGEETRELWVHRKGAAPADQGVVPCPGSHGDFFSPLGMASIMIRHSSSRDDLSITSLLKHNPWFMEQADAMAAMFFILEVR